MKKETLNPKPSLISLVGLGMEGWGAGGSLSWPRLSMGCVGFRMG